MRAELLLKREAVDQAKSALVELLSDPNLDSASRLRAYWHLAKIAARINDWSTAERHCQSALTMRTHEVHENLIWLLIESQVKVRAFDRAATTIDRYQPDPHNPDTAWLWLMALQERPIDTAQASQMIAMALQFESDPKLSAALLNAVVTRTRDEGPNGTAGPLDPRQPLTDELRRRAFAAIDQHVSRHGASSPFRVVSAPSAEQLVEAVANELRRDDATMSELVQQIREGRIPQGMLTPATGRGYAYLLALRAIGIFLAGNPFDSEHDAELAATASALNGDVVVDASSLLIGSLLADFPTLRGQFQRLLIPQASRDDIRTARTEMDGLVSSSGTMGWSSIASRPVFFEPDVVHQMASSQRLKLIESAAARTETRIVDALHTFPELDRTRYRAWLAPIELAKTLEIPLWSDDLAIRRIARHVGVSTLGTISLLDHLNTQAIDGTPADDARALDRLEAERRSYVRAALQQRVVDVPTTVDELVALDEAEGFSADLAAVTVGRPAWWMWSAEPLHEVARLFDLAAVCDRDAEQTWRAIAMQCLAEMNKTDPQRVAVCLAALVLIGVDDQPDHKRLAKLLVLAEETSKRFGGASPRNHLAAAASELSQLRLLPNPTVVMEILRHSQTDTEDSSDNSATRT